MTMLVVTHEMSFARDVSDRVLFLDHGTIAADAPPAEFFGAQSNERIRTFLGQIAH
jgi:ABC-type polar amino acid transport system ATPase subunit